ncbi:MAG: PilZ domain-containing protein [Deltaproteobacteria bacterium]|nr:PilZ domain-containing protein [Deltaproteobacteria bacterium]
MAQEDTQGAPKALEDDDRRVHTRFEVSAYVDYTGSEILLCHHIENISLGGICVRTTTLEELGTKVDLVINFPDLDQDISVVGEDVWANPHEPMDLGLRFIDLDDKHRAVLREYIAAQRKTH